MNYSNLTKLQQTEIDEVLADFGLNDKDKKVYLSLLEIGQTTLTPLSRLVKLPTTTTQSVLKRLTDIGIISVTVNKSRQSYEAHDPIVFKNLLDKQSREFSSIIPFLQQLKNDTGISPKIRIYYRERATDIFEQAINCKSKHIYEMVSAKELQSILGERFHFTRRRLEKDIKLSSLRVEQTEIKKYSKKTHEKELREAKFLPREITFEANILFWDNTVAFFSKNSEGLAWTVQSQSIHTMIKQIFDLLWSISRRMETDETPNK